MRISNVKSVQLELAPQWHMTQQELQVSPKDPSEPLKEVTWEVETWVAETWVAETWVAETWVAEACSHAQ